ncbi:MAG: orotidine-5'-phosphate decarboxylase [Myxococcaceae bacterium]|nr:orotidine-5'-phosphate decarboxylase [Myxococcaceae bacterium]
MTPNDAREKIALAADLPLPEAQALYEKVAPWVGVVKVGLSLFVEHGPAAVRAFTDTGARVFLDLKLHDIPNTVHLAASRAGELGAAYLTLHAQGGREMVRAAVEGAREGAARANTAPPKILAVTVLTSLSAADLQGIGYPQSPDEVARTLATLAESAGVDGLVCSPREVEGLRQILQRRLLLCTPGIRPAGSAQDDQARAETPTRAIQAGADLLVIGRPIHAAKDPVAAARSIVEALQNLEPTARR